MFTIAYNKQTKFILYWRYDDSTNLEKPTAQHHLSVYCDNNNLLVGDYEAVELPWNSKAKYIIGRDMFDDVNYQIYADPNWIEPTPALTSTE